MTEGDEIGYTVGTAAELLAAVPEIDAVPLLLDTTRRAGETRRMRRRRTTELLRALFERYSDGEVLTRDVNILVSAVDYGGGLEGAAVFRVNPDGSVGEPIGAVTSAALGTYDQAVRLSQDQTVDIRVFWCQRCPECGRECEEFYTLACSRCDCGYRESGCVRCLSPGGMACLASRQRAEPIGGRS
jgi:hypothetical protein